jgi:hypothetical protein
MTAPSAAGASGEAASGVSASTYPPPSCGGPESTHKLWANADKGATVWVKLYQPEA